MISAGDEERLASDVRMRVLGKGEERIARVAEGEERLAVGDLGSSTRGRESVLAERSEKRVESGPHLLGIVLLELDLVLLSRASVDEVQADESAKHD